MALSSGTRLGPYEIQSPLGAGGMGEVYRARDTRLGRDVAIKVLPEAFAKDAILRERFEREARTISALNHPNICTLYDVGHQNGTDYLVMELLEGESLAQRLAKGALPVAETLRIGAEMADALERAHRQGIVHRDLKPGNIVLTKSGAKLLDFGLAKPNPLSTGSGSALSGMATQASPVSPVTREGTVIGTYQYMSPEQVEGKEADARSDIFALGAVLYEMATGKRAFEGKSQISVASAILEKEPEPISRVQPMTPPALEHVVTTCLAKDPEERFQTAHDVRLELKWIAEGASKPAVQAALPSKKPVTRVLAETIVMAAGLVLVVLLYRWSYPRPPTVADFTQITNDARVKVDLLGRSSMVTDGERLYFSEVTGTGAYFAQVSTAGGETVLTPSPTPNAYIADLSTNPSALLIAEFSGYENEAPFYLLPLPGGAPRRLDDLRARDGTWSPDGQAIVYSQGNSIYQANADGTGVRKLADLPSFAWWLRWSPDGKKLRFTVGDPRAGSSSLWELSLSGQSPHPLLPTWGNPPAECCGSWTPDGRFYFFQSARRGRTDIWVLPERRWWFPQSPEATQLTAGPLGFRAPVPSRDGQQLFAIGEQRRGELVRYDQALQQFLPYLGGLSADWVAFSPDAKWVAYAALPDQTLWRSRIDGSDRLQLTFSPMQGFELAWSPDGKRIAFMGRMPWTPWRIYVVSADGGTPEEVLHEDRVQTDPSWCPDGHTLLFGYVPWLESTLSISRMDLQTRKVAPLEGSNELVAPRCSPNGRYITALTKDSQTLMIFDTSTNNWQVLARGNINFFTWSGNSEYFYYDTFGIDPAYLRVRVSDHRVERLVNLKDIQRPYSFIGPYSGLAPDGSLLVIRDTGSQEVYGLRLQVP